MDEMDEHTISRLCAMAMGYETDLGAEVDEMVGVFEPLLEEGDTMRLILKFNISLIYDETTELWQARMPPPQPFDAIDPDAQRAVCVCVATRQRAN